jgi:hypothetical protein
MTEPLIVWLLLVQKRALGMTSRDGSKVQRKLRTFRIIIRVQGG